MVNELARHWVLLKHFVPTIHKYGSIMRERERGGRGKGGRRDRKRGGEERGRREGEKERGEEKEGEKEIKKRERKKEREKEKDTDKTDRSDARKETCTDIIFTSSYALFCPRSRLAGLQHSVMLQTMCVETKLPLPHL